MPLDPLNDPLLRAPRSHAPTIAGMTEAANTATPEQLADFVDAIGASGGGGGGGHTPTDLGATATPTGVTVTSSTGADALLPLATAANAGLMAPAQHAKLADLPAAAQLAADHAAQALAITAATTADAIADTLETAPAADLARIQSSVSGDRAKLNATQQTQQTAGATTALLNTAKTALKDPAGGADISLGGSRYKIVGTLENVVLASASAGDEGLITNLGSNGSGVIARRGTSAWRIPGRQSIYFAANRLFSTAGTTEQVLRSVLIPGGIFSVVDALRIGFVLQKNGSTDALTNLRIRCGPNGTILDPALNTITSAMSATNRQFTGSLLLTGTASSVDNSGYTSLDYAGSGVGTIINQTAAVDTTAPWHLSITTQMAGSTNLVDSSSLHIEVL